MLHNAELSCKAGPEPRSGGGLGATVAYASAVTKQLDWSSVMLRLSHNGRGLIVCSREEPMPNYRGNEKQDLMIPVCLDDQLVPGTIEHAINWIVDREVDTSVFDAAYHNDHGGRSAYDPAALVKVILFAYSKGILSSRKIETACRTNVVFMALSGDIRPDHATIARFVTGHPAAVRRVFRDVLMIAAQGDLVGGEVFALDGCKISSNAAKEHSGIRRELEHKLAKLEARLDQMLRTHRSADEAGESDHDDDHIDGPGLGSVDRYRSQIDRIKSFLDSHPPRAGSTGREVKANLTDNESATLKSGSGYLQGYNALATGGCKAPDRTARRAGRADP